MPLSQNDTTGRDELSAPNDPQGRSPQPVSYPLCIDLDGTLIKSDLLWESILLAIRRRPLDVFRWPLWLLHGRARFKREISKQGTPSPEMLPYQSEVVAYARNQGRCGRKLVLASGSEYKLVKSVADHLGIFDHVIASDGKTNCIKHSKVNAIRRLLDDEPFEYIGNSTQDLPVWEAAQDASAVTSNQRLLHRLKMMKTPVRLFKSDQNQLTAVIGSLRLKQWAKNLLLIVPMFVSNRIPSAGKNIDSAELLSDLGRLMIAFVTFGLCASSVYVLNDLLDIDADRKHPKKRLRPIAAGQLKLSTAIYMSGILFALGIVGAVTLMGNTGMEYALMLVAYVALSSAYSLFLKRKLVIDVIVLAGLYAHRILAGGVAVEVFPSSWLLGFAMFFFLSLAFVKRYDELALFGTNNEGMLTGRGYRAADLDLIRTVGATSGYLAVLVFCLYIKSPEVEQVYDTPVILWAICPVLLYWITRMWFFAERRAIHDDPLLFAITDRVSYLTGIIIVTIVLLARWV
ncbi:MAG: hypothetical protein CMJ20_11965 [Phycisphaeraceae bacterium]|nr:hypothetical protein [Phycisphaeraceae bacterium]